MVVLRLCLRNFHEYRDNLKKGEKMRKWIVILCTVTVALVPAIAFGFDAEPTVAGHNNESTTVGKDPSTLAGWYLGANIPSPGSYGGAGACYWTNDSVWLYALNGDQNGSGMALGELRVYNVRTDTWTSLPNDTGRAWTSMTRIGTNLYAVGGLPNGATGWAQMTGSLRRYSITGNAWTRLTPAPTPTGSSGWVAYQDSLIYAIGGMGTGAAPITNVQLYNVTAGTWRAATALPVARANGWAAIKNDTIYYGCGVGPTTSTYNNTIYVGVISQTNRATIAWSTSSVTYPGNDRHRMDASLFGGQDETGDLIIIGPGAGSVWWGTGTDSYTWAGGTSSFTSIGPVQITSDVMSGAGSYIEGLYRKWRFVIASGLVMAAPYHILTVQVYADSSSLIGVNENNDNALKTSCSLRQNYPNPFKSATTIKYGLPVSANVKLAVYDALGREVAVLVNGYVKAGEHQVKLNADNLDEGVYFYRLEAGDLKKTNKLILLK